MCWADQDSTEYLWYLLHSIHGTGQPIIQECEVQAKFDVSEYSHPKFRVRQLGYIIPGSVGTIAKVVISGT